MFRGALLLMLHYDHHLYKWYPCLLLNPRKACSQEIVNMHFGWSLIDIGCNVEIQTPVAHNCIARAEHCGYAPHVIVSLLNVA